jgi:hypothetical protein
VGTPPDSVKRLVDLSACNAQADHFDQDRKVFLSPDYKEEQLRASSGPSLSIRHSSFVIRTSPHESLGWEVANKHALSEVEGAGLTGACPELGRRVAGWTKVPVVNVAMKRFAAWGK